MARPKKNNADYFPHVAGMRNDTRIKAVRTKFGIEGYAVYCMFLEYLSNSEFFEFKNDELNTELAAGDFGIELEKLTSMLQYFVKLDLIQLDPTTGIITCKRLENYLEPLLSKRKRDRGEVIAVENPQSKVKESKEKKSKEEKAATPVVLPFDTDVFLNAWNEWIQFRIQLRKKIVPSTAKKQLKFLARWPEEIAIKIINQSIEKGWTGLFEVKDSINTQKNHERKNTNSAAVLDGTKRYSDNWGG